MRGGEQVETTAPELVLEVRNDVGGGDGREPNQKADDGQQHQKSVFTGRAFPQMREALRLEFADD